MQNSCIVATSFMTLATSKPLDSDFQLHFDTYCYSWTATLYSECYHNCIVCTP